MKDYSDNVPWSAVWIAFAQLAAVIAVLAAVYLVTRITPEREAELKAQGAAEADRKAAAAGGWSAWIRGTGVPPVKLSCVSVGSSLNGRDARSPKMEVR